MTPVTNAPRNAGGIEPANHSPRPLLLVLFCGEGGDSMGYHRAGLQPIGLDANDDLAHRLQRPRPRPLNRYPFPAFEGDAIEALDDLLAGASLGPFRLEHFAGIHASPPCQRYSSITRINVNLALDDLPDLIGPVRERLRATGLPYVIENTERAPLLDSVLLCGSMFDPMLDVQRHRLFETNWGLAAPPWPCRHKLWAPRFRGADYRGRRSKRLAKVVPVYGGTRFAGDNELRRRAMEIDWMTGYGLKEAIPPRYSQFIGEQLLQRVMGLEAAA